MHSCTTQQLVSALLPCHRMVMWWDLQHSYSCLLRAQPGSLAAKSLRRLGRSTTVCFQLSAAKKPCRVEGVQGTRNLILLSKNDCGPNPEGKARSWWKLSAFGCWLWARRPGWELWNLGQNKNPCQLLSTILALSARPA